MRNWKRKKRIAFTLVELLVVIAIVGLLSTIVLAVTSGVSEQGRIAKGLQFSKHLENSLGAYLVGRWSFDEGTGTTTSDVSGWGNSAVLTGGPVWRCVSTDENYTPSGRGCSLEFDGYDSRVESSSGNGFNTTVNNVTIAAWVKPDVLSYGDYQIVLQGTNNYSYFLGTVGGVIAWLIGRQNIDSWNIVNNSGALTDGWNYIVGTYNGTLGLAKNYLNGSFVSEKSGYAEPSQNMSSARIGLQGVGNYAFDGLIDEVSVYAATLTSAQIQSQYYAGLNRLLAKGLINQKEYQERLAKS
jgi:prepilin-type N-terminal cleavage/methylation domain-containing protein